MGNVSNKIENHPSNKIPKKSHINQNTLLKNKHDLIKSRIRSSKKTRKTFHKLNIKPSQDDFFSTFNSKLIKEAHSAQTLMLDLRSLGLARSNPRFFSKLRNLTNLEKLQVYSNRFPKRDFKIFCQNLHTMKSLKHLELALSISEVDQSCFKSLVSGIKKLKNLQQITFIIPNLQPKEKEFAKLSSNLKLLSRLRYLKLDLKWSFQNTVLTKMFKNLSLSTLPLDMRAFKFENNQLHDFLITLREFQPNLKALVLIFNNTMIRSQIFLYIEEFKKFQHLKHLVFVLDNKDFKVEPELLKEIVQSFDPETRNRMNKITFQFLQPSLYFPDPQVFTDLIQQIAISGFRLLPTMNYSDPPWLSFEKHLHLTFQNNPLPKLKIDYEFGLVSNRREVRFAHFFGPIQDLYTFDLRINFMKTKHFDEVLTNLKQFPHLSNLALDFSQQFVLEEEAFSIKKITSGLSKIPVFDKLQSLSLNFAGKMSLSGKCLGKLGSMLAKMKGLQRLSLIFCGDSSNKKKEIEALVSSLETLVHLKYLRIIGISCPEMENFQVKFSPKIVKLSVEFTNSPSIRSWFPDFPDENE